MRKDLLLEIGCEELPHTTLKQEAKDIARLFMSLLSEYRLACMEMELYYTARRISMIAHGVPDQQEDIVKEIKGPPKRVAYDANGNVTRALSGFLERNNIKISDIKFVNTNKGEYVYAFIPEKGKPTFTVLPVILKELFEKYRARKGMRWGAYQKGFIRPIRWLLVLYGEEMIDFTFNDVTAANFTYGHRWLAPSQIKVKDSNDYLARLSQAHVILDQTQRRNLIKELLFKEAADLKGKPLIPEDLLDVLVCLVEKPFVVKARFPAKFLELPKEVVITSMQHHQKYFPVLDEDGNLLPAFLAVLNNCVEENIEEIKENLSRVLIARLNDAEFFYKEDLKQPLIEKVKDLSGIIFVKELGTMLEKTERIKAISEKLVELFYGDIDDPDILRCAFLAKADLTTSMVYEFPELEGIMGEIYAKENGEPFEVSKGIYEHYLPRFKGDSLPQTKSGKIVSVADKIDTIFGCTLSKLEVSGSQDPYGLRRLANGIIDILMNSSAHISIEDIIEVTDEIYKSAKYEYDSEEIVQKVKKFFEKRINIILKEMGYEYDIVNAVMEVRALIPDDVSMRAEILTKWKKQKEFQQLVIFSKRVNNILKSYNKFAVNKKCLLEKIEKEIFEKFKEVEEKVKVHLSNYDYNEALNTILILEPYINKFFDNILVMHEDDTIRENRLSLLNCIRSLFLRIADFSEIVMEEKEVSN